MIVVNLFSVTLSDVSLREGPRRRLCNYSSLSQRVTRALPLIIRRRDV